jgi:predicted DNA-binding transcriptional regulator AlpA
MPPSAANTLFNQYQGKMVELYATEVPELEAERLRIHKSPNSCRFPNCSNPEWYISDRVYAFHDRRSRTEPSWKFPTSCPEHRRVSKQMYISKQNPDLCPKTGKRSFYDEQSAQVFASTLPQKQYVYKCDQCDEWHLSSLSPEEQVQLEERQKQRDRENRPAPVITRPSTPATPTAATETSEAKACRLYREGSRVAEIATEVGASEPTIYGWLKKNGIPMRTGSGSRGPRKIDIAPESSPFKPPVVDYDAEEARLTHQLEEVKRKKQMIADAKVLRVEMMGMTAFRITKEGEHATLPLAELEPLIEKLMALVPQQAEVA